MRLILIRHGECSWNRERRIQGSRTDNSLNERGRAQAEEIALALQGEEITAIYSSPLSRALSTAEPLARARRLEINIDPDLKEIDAGELEGLSEPELRERHGDFLKEWRRGNLLVRLPGGESLEELQDRVWHTIQRMSERHPDGVVVAFSHLIAILTLVCRALGIDLTNMWRLRQYEAAMNVLEIGPQGSFLLRFNDTCHLEAKGLDRRSRSNHD